MYIYVCLCNKSNRDDNDLVVNRTFGLCVFCSFLLFCDYNFFYKYLICVATLDNGKPT